MRYGCGIGEGAGDLRTNSHATSNKYEQINFRQKTVPPLVNKFIFT